ncbi:hypothetical protein Pint_29748 [Pistacia integerrima]|uniref:Uncharacterized protein n=1 Tax=Pistacia integerrima TaxID=434235 RepID=A0ACC0X144_9ROSI|nr:hypothetical protein Pint_29748 [Pistacia integerrima]
MNVSHGEIETIEIVVPNLQELALQFMDREMPRVIDIIGCSHLKKLTFRGISLTNQQFHHFISTFPLLKDLILEDCDLESITISSNQLKKFQVISCDNMKALDLDTPNLLSFTYMNSPIPTSRINALCSRQVEFLSYFTCDTQWCLKLMEFLGISYQIEDLRIDVMPTVSSFKLEEFRKSFPSPSCNVV